ncbi:MAG: sulfatase-like hydrolase/transferase [Verrucomicrobia bacterium]|nr:sulfatase-like hydrolase/transferase [Verrucomicrobiota bacterium]
MKISPLQLAILLMIASAPLVLAHPEHPADLSASAKEELRETITRRFLQSDTARKWFKVKPREETAAPKWPQRPVTVAALSGFHVSSLLAPTSPPAPAGNALLMQASFAPFKPKVRFNWDATTFFLESDNTPDGMPDKMVGITTWQQQVPIPAAYFSHSTSNENNAGSLGYQQPNHWRIPLVPTPSASPIVIYNPPAPPTNFLRGAVALASNGIAIFNPSNNGGNVSYEIGELDFYGGHCGLADDYHYHIIPTHLNSRFGGPLGDDKPVAWALDGYPIYGYLEPDGSPRQALDAEGGHDHGGWGYHYHAIGTTAVDATHPYGTPQSPYMMKAFHGTVVNFGNQVDGQPAVGNLRGDGTGGYNAKAVPGAYIVAFMNPAPLVTDGSGNLGLAAGVNLTACSTTAGSATVTCASTAGLSAGLAVVGQGVGNNATITSVTNGTQFVLSKPALLTTTGKNFTAVSLTGASPDMYLMRVNMAGADYDECWTINRKVNPRSLTMTWRAQALVNNQLSGPVLTTTQTYTPTAGTAPANRLTAYPMEAWSEVKLPDSGQLVSTTVTFGEDSDYTTPPEANPQSFTDNGDGTVTDHVTGLMWQKLDAGEMTWENAVNNASTQNTGGHTDWRLPNPHELFSLFNHENNGVALNQTYFPQNGAGAQYWWSRDIFGTSTTNVWCANSGGGLGPKPKSETISAGGTFRYHARYVRLARNNMTHNYTNNGDGTVTDTDTSLMWTQLPGSARTWEAALAYTETLATAGYTDWRLPNIKELQTLTDYSLATVSGGTATNNKPCIHRTLFAKTLPGCATTVGSPIVTTTDTEGLVTGMTVIDPYSIAGSYINHTTTPTITAINPGVSFTLSSNATGTGSGLILRALPVATAYWSSTSNRGTTTEAWLLELGVNNSVPASEGPPRGSQGIISYQAKTASFPVFAVRTTVVTTQIAVSQGTTSLLDGVGTVAYGNVNVGGSSSKTFTINNTGTTPLTISGLTIDGANSTNFSVSGSPDSTIAAGASTTFSVSFNALTAGAKTAALHIANSDPAVPSFDINLTGTGFVPPPVISEISVNPISPTSSDPVKVTARITPGTGGTISGATLTYDLGAQVSTDLLRETFAVAGSNNWNGTNPAAINAWTTAGAGNTRQATGASNRTAAITLTNCTLTAGSPNVTCGSTANLFPGMTVAGPNLPINTGTVTTTTRISSIPGPTQLVLTANATASGTATLTVNGASLTNCTTTAGSSSVTCDSTGGLVTGMSLTGTGLANNATVSSVTNSTTFVMSANPVTPASAFTITASSAALEFNGGTTASSATLTNSVNTSGTSGYVEFYLQNRDLFATNNNRWSFDVSPDGGSTWNTRLSEDWNSTTVNLANCVLNSTGANAGSTTVTCTTTTGLTAGRALYGPVIYSAVACGTSNGSNVVTCTNTTGLQVNLFVTGTGIPANARIGSITDNTSFTLVTGTSPGTALNATVTGSTTVAATYLSPTATVASVHANGTQFTLGSAAYFNTSAAPVAIAATTLNHDYATKADGTSQPYRYNLAGAELGANLKIRWQFAGYSATAPTRAPRCSVDDVRINRTTGAPPVTVTLYDDGTNGDTTAGDGIYTGTIPAQANGSTVNFTVSATGNGGTSTSGATSYLVAPSPVITTVSPLPAGNTISPYSQTLSATGGSGTGYTWNLFSGSLPSGLTLSGSGVLGGTATTGGTFNFTARVTDSASRSATKAFALTITAVTPPNVVIIVTDDQGWGDVGYHTPAGQVPIETPTMDSFASTGIRLERFYATTVCSVTRATLMTGRNAIRHGTNNERGLDLSEHLLPQTFKAAGYQTFMCGKWHLGGSDKNIYSFPLDGRPVRVIKEGLQYAPHNRGWDSHYGQYSGAIDYFTHNSAEPENLDLPDWWLNGVQQDGPAEHTDSQGNGGWSPDLLADKAISQIQNRDPSKPMLLHVAFNSIHGPVSAPPSLLAKYGNPSDPTRYIANANRRLIAAAVDGMDKAMGRVLAALDTAGISNNTIVVWFGDNGGDETKGSLNDPLRGTKGDSYEGGMREPAGIRWPGVLPAGVTSNQPVWVGDLFPTLCAATGVTPRNTKPLDGVNLWPALQAASNSAVVSRGTPLVTVSATPVAIYPFTDPVNGGTKDFKLIRNRVGTTVVNELYNLTDDPAESTDLSANTTYATIVNTLTNAITAITVENMKPYIGPPLITNTAAQGGTITLYAPFTSYPGAAPTVQWRKGGANIGGGVVTQITDSGAVAVKGTYAATLTLANLTPADAGTYDVIVTNNIGSTTSDPGTLTVTFGAPVLNPLPAFTKGTSQTVTWPAVAGANAYTIQRSATSDFSPVLSSQTVNTPSATFTGLTNGQACHYRATATDGTSVSGYSNIVSSTPDAQNPVVTLTAPANGITTSQTTVNVQGTASDSLSGVVSVMVNGVAATTADNYANWSATVPLAIGTNTLTATVTDNAQPGGNTGTASITITCTPLAPVIGAVATGPTAPTYIDPVTILAQVTPGASPVATVQLSYDLGTPVSTTIFRETFNNSASNNWNGSGSLNPWTTVGAGNVRQAVATSNRTVPLTLTSVATNGTTTVTCASTAGLWPGMLITGPNIAGSINGTATGNTTIASVTNATTFELSQPATGSGTGLTLTAAGVTLANCTTIAGTSVTCASTAGLLNGMSLTGTGLANNATVASVTGATTFTMNAAPTTPGPALTIVASGAAAEFNGGTANLTDSIFTTTNPINASGTAGYVEFWVQTRDLAATNNCQWALQVSPDNGTTWTTRLTEDWNSETVNLAGCLLNTTDAAAGSTTVTCASTTGLTAGQTMGGPAIYITGVLTTGQSTVTCLNTSGLLPGMFLQGTGIPNNTRIGTITPNTSFTLVTGPTATPVNATGAGGSTAIAATPFAAGATVASVTNATTFVISTAAYVNTTAAPIAVTATTVNHGFQLFRYDFTGAELGTTTKLRWLCTGYTPASPTRAPRISIDDLLVATTAPPPTVTLTMFDDGLHGDGAAGDGLYGAQIPAQPGSTAVTYRITATGTNTNSTTSPNYAYSVNPALTDATIRNAEFLGIPANTRITLNVVATTDQYAYVEYGTSPGQYTLATPPALFTIDPARPEFYNPIEITLTGLQPDTRYFYRFRHRSTAGTAYNARGERSFRTARPRGSSFVFTVTADPHLDVNSDLPLFTRSMTNIGADAPDLHIDLGDIFMTDKLADGTAGIPPEFFGGVTPNQPRLNDRALFFRAQFERFCHSVPFFYTQGNHESEYGYLFNAATDKENNIPAWNLKARKAFYPTPVPDSFYTGNGTPKDYPGGTLGLLENYYAYEWGDALFIALDPYWNTNTSPNQVDDAWQWTLGKPQYDWLKATLQGSTAKYKFVFLHHLVGGTTTLADGITKNVAGRGGIEVADRYEWGGKNADGSPGFATKRPGWDMPIHQLLVQNKVSVVFHGHDHLYAFQTLDGLVYLECPQPGTANFTTLGSAGDGKYTQGTLLPNSGHIRVNVTPGQATVSYVRAYRATDENATRRNGDIAHSFEIAPAVLTPEIQVYDGTLAAGTEIQDAAGVVSFGTAVTGAGVTRTFTVANTGPGPLLINGVTASGDWTVDTTGLNTTLAPAASTTFTATFAPTAAGSRAGTLVIATNDADEAAFDIATSGTGKLPQTLNFAAIDPQTCGTPLTLNATADSGLPVGYAITRGAALAGLSDNVVTFTGAGEVTIAATQPGDATYAAAPPVSRTFTVAKGDQVLTFGAGVPANVLTGATVALSATSNRNLTPVGFAVIGGPGSLSGSNLTFTGPGAVVVRASQAGNSAFNPATADWTITAFASQSITFAVIPDQVADTPLPVSASSTSGLPVTLTITGGTGFATLSGNTVTFSGSGAVTLEATQPGDTTYAAAAPVSRSFTVGKAGQTLAWSPAVPATVGQGAVITLSATSNRGLTPVTYSVLSGPGEISGSTLTFTGTGPVVTRASQAGNNVYGAATADKTITATAAPVAGDGSADGTVNDLIRGRLTATDPDTPAGSLTFTRVGAPSHGTVDIIAGTGVYEYRPEPGYLGVDQFTFKAADGLNESNVATITLNIDPVVPDWIWMDGPSLTNVKGSPTAPGAREKAALWTDPAGRLYLYGGSGFGVTTGPGLLGDLFRLDPGTRTWTRLKGSPETGAAASAGAPGVEADTNQPGARSDAATWVAPDGLLWLFGGTAPSGSMADLWNYNPASGNWTFVAGSLAANANGVYGTQGIAAAGNQPGARSAAASWIDRRGHLHLFGGRGYGATGSIPGALNDLWSFNPSTRQWTHLTGSNATNAPGVYGSPGLDDPSNTPGGRSQAAAWTDKLGNFYLFGGTGATSTSLLSDLWCYSPPANRWRWVRGAATPGARGIYGQLGLTSSTAQPGARTAAASWVDAAGRLWLFGGSGLATSATAGLLGDVWVYDIPANTWTWMKGTNFVNGPPTHGTLRVPAIGNTPGGRRDSARFVDPAGDLWLFGGGTGSKFQSDLWKLDLPALPVVEPLAASPLANPSPGPAGLALNASANPQGTPATGWFRIARSPDFSDSFTTSARSLGAGMTALPFSESLADLEAGTTYHVQAMAANAAGTGFGQARSVVTPGAPQPPQAGFTAAGAGINEQAGAIARIAVELDAPAPGPGTISYTLGGTASAGTDYTAPAPPLRFTAGQTSAVITIPILDDHAVESPETLTLTLGNPTGGITLGPVTLFTLTITDTDSKPQIGTQPQSRFVIAGGAGVRLSVGNLTGTPPFTYQWLKNGLPIRGATSPDLAVASTTTGTGTYSVVVTNPVGSTLSESAMIHRITVANASLSRTLGSSLTLTATATSPVPIQYAWHKQDDVNDSVLPGATTNTLLLTNLSPQDAGSYRCRVTAGGLSADTGITRLVVVSMKPGILPIDTLPTGQVGEAYSYQVELQDDPLKDASAFSAKGLPAGLSISPTGLISGRPVESVANRAVTLTASNSIGTSLTEACTLTILPLPATIPGNYVASGTIDGMKVRLDITASATGGFSAASTDAAGTSSAVRGGLVSMDIQSGPTPGARWMAACLLTTRGKGAVNLELAFDPADPNRVGGTFSEPGTGRSMGTITGFRNIWSRTSPAAHYAGFYSALLPTPPSFAADQQIPQGTGSLGFTVTAADGTFNLNAVSAEGVTHTSSSFLGPDGEILQFAHAASVGSLLAGTPRIVLSSGDNFATNSLEGSLSWSKAPASASSATRLYRPGFEAMDLTLQGGKYTAPAAGTVLMGLPRTVAAPNVRLTFSQGGLPPDAVPPLAFQISNPSGTTQKATLPTAGGPQNPARISFTPVSSTGLFSGSFTVSNPVSSLVRVVRYQGRITRDATGYHAAGYFLLPQLPQPGETLAKTSPILSGAVLLAPIP